MTPTCWHLHNDGTTCEAKLAIEGRRYICPHGHYLRQYDDLTQWLKDHLTFRMGPGAPFQERT